MKNKKMIVICIICIFVILVVIIFFKTDLLKTKEMLFWKYMWKEKEQIEQVVSNKEIKDFENNIEKSTYIKEGKVTIETKYNFIKPIKINIKEIGDNLQKKKNTQISSLYNNQNIADMNIITDNDYILFKCDKLYDKYIGFENNNLKQLAKKIGITNTDFIPDKIKETNYNELFSITDEQKRNFIEQYIPIFRKHIKNKHYLKEINVQENQEDDILDIYTLNIYEKDLNELLVDILGKVHDDNIMLDYLCSKVKIINDSSEFTDINKMKEKIENIIDDLKKDNTREEKLLTIHIYKKENDLIRLEFIIENNRKISVTTNESKNELIINQYDVKNNIIHFSNIEGIINTLLNNISEIHYTRIVENEKKSNVEISAVCKIGLEEIKINYEFIEEVVENLKEIEWKNDVDFIELDESIYRIVKHQIENMVKFEE